MEVLVILCALLLLAAAESQKETLCKQRATMCQNLVSHVGHLDFPSDAKMFDHLCRLSDGYFTCMTDVFIMCPDLKEPRQSVIEADEGKVKAACDKNSQLYEGIVRHIRCYRNTLLSYTELCQNISRDIRDLADYNIDVSPEEYKKYECLRSLMEISCMVRKVRRTCGEEAEAVALDFISVLDKESDLSCPGSSFQEVIDLVRELELMEEIKTDFEKTVVKIRV